MNNNTVRFVNEFEMDLIKYLFSVDRKMVGVILDDRELEVRLNKIRDRVSKNEMKIAMVFDETGNPYCMTTGFYMKKIGGFYKRYFKFEEIHSLLPCRAQCCMYLVI